MNGSGVRWWAVRRRVEYGAGFSAFWVLVGTLVYFGFFYAAPQCFDAVMNGDERGVDCGGSCVRICAVDVMPPQAIWAESFEIVPGQYNAVAYIENRNTNAATPALEYTFRLMDGAGVIAERSGTTILPPGSTYPVFEGRVLTAEGRKPTKTEIELKPAAVWVPATVGRSQFRTTEIALSGVDLRPRLTALLENTEVTSASDVEVVATIFNELGKPLTSSQTLLDEIAGLSREEVVFTWPQPIAKTLRSCEVPSDVMIVLDRSGSMAADGGTPPEPLESAKKAAQTFVNLLQARDTFGFLSYATTPTKPIEQTLTADRTVIMSAIAGVTMGVDGTQYTNMGDAFTAALAELTSPRHREDARKVIVFLTDGDVTRPINPKTGTADRAYAAQYAQTAAEAAKQAGVIIYTIGFGDFLAAPAPEVARDAALIRNLASDPANYYEAPTIADLEAVYKKIATSICEVGPARIDIIPKTSTGFELLQ